MLFNLNSPFMSLEQSAYKIFNHKADTNYFYVLFLQLQTYCSSMIHPQVVWNMQFSMCSVGLHAKVKYGTSNPL